MLSKSMAIKDFKEKTKGSLGQSLKDTYKRNEKVLNNVAWGVFYFTVLRVTATYVQKNY